MSNPRVQLDIAMRHISDIAKADKSNPFATAQWRQRFLTGQVTLIDLAELARKAKENGQAALA